MSLLDKLFITAINEKTLKQQIASLNPKNIKDTCSEGFYSN